jgi:hypothetical protein
VPVDNRDELTREYFSGHNIVVCGTMRDQVLPSGQALTRDHAKWLLGAPDDSRVFVKECSNRIEMEVTHYWLKEPRTLEIDRNGVMHWQGFILKDEAPAGLGTRMAATSLLTAASLGLKRCELTAWGPPRYNGHYTWARLGFDAEFSQSDIQRLKRDGRTGIRSVSELMTTDSERDWWKAFGWTMEMAFDLDANSKSMQTLENYLALKGVAL